MTSVASNFEQAELMLGAWIIEKLLPEQNRLDLVIAPEHLIEAVTALEQQCWGYLITITGMDPGPDTGQLELLYHFGAGPAVLTLRVRISRTEASIPSICAVVLSASFFEREISEMFGIHVVGTPDPQRLFLPDDWPADIYPLRKDAVLSDLA